MKTYQDLQALGDNEKDRMQFVFNLITEHRGSALYQNARVAEQYNDHKNVTIMKYQKILYSVTGEAIPDRYSANHKMRSNFFHRFIEQENQHLLSNGVTWANEDTKDKLGKDFDTRLQEAGESALVGGQSFGYWNYDHMEVFKITEFAPLNDETNSALMAGVRFWQIDVDKPLRATLYEVDGYTDYMWRDGQGEILHEKRGYIEQIKGTPADGMEIYNYRNYPTFPIVPLWGNKAHQSELEGIREQIDAYDLIKNHFCNDVDDASLIYWIIKNAGGMDEVDLARFINRVARTKTAMADTNGAEPEGHTMDVPYASREALLDRIRADLYEDAQALDTKQLASGGQAVTASIKTAYMPLNSKCNGYEYCINDFLKGILQLAGIEDETPTFTRDMLVNKTEEITSLIQAAQYLPEDYVTEKIVTILGDGDRAEEIIESLSVEDVARFGRGQQEADNSTDETTDSQENEQNALGGAPER